MEMDFDVMQHSERVINLMDCHNPREIFLIDEYSDATEFGGQSETQLLHNEKEGFLRVQAKFLRERQGLEKHNDVMFCGFQNLYLLKQEYDMYNGIRIIMKPPMYPCKIGLHIKMSMGNEHECFFGHLVDNQNPNPDDWQAYEIPINLMNNDLVMSKIYQP